MDEIDIKLTQEKEIPRRKTYVVASNDGLFKNGKQYAKGDKIKLDEQTANRFLKQEEISNVTK